MSLKDFIKDVAEILGVKNYLTKVHWKYAFKKQIQHFNEGCKTALFKVDDILTSNNLQYWLNYGTLLGAYRDHAFVKDDYDLDIGMWWKDYEKVKELFLKNGFNLIIECHFGAWDAPNKIGYRFEYAGVFVDFDFYTIDEDEMAYTYSPMFKEGWDYSKKGVRHPFICERMNNPIRGFSQINFLGRDFWIPTNAEEYLVYNYGKNWRIPQSVAEGFDYHDVGQNITIEDIEGWMIKY